MGGPSNQVPMPNQANLQFPADFGDYCFSWAPRDASAAKEEANGDMAPIYLGEGYGYNPVTKTRFYVSGLVPAESLVPGKEIVFPQGVNVPDVDEAADVQFPTNGMSWCYVGDGCGSAQSDGWSTWSECGDGKAWDNQPKPKFPEVTECPVTYNDPQGKMHLLTRKVSTVDHDVCVGTDDKNECHDGSSLGGAAVGYVSTFKLADGMVQLQRAYNADAKDTCVFPFGEQTKYCTAPGSYGTATEVGYAFTGEHPGTIKAEFKSSAAEKDSCFGIPGSEKDACWTDGAVLGSVYLLDPVHHDSWSVCGTPPATEEKWSFTIATHVEGELAATDPNTEQVSWVALAEGVYETSDGTKFQAGISFVPSGSDFHTVQFHESFGAAPVVVANILAEGGVPNLKMREADTEAFFVKQGDADVVLHWLAVEAKDGYLSSYPFSAGMLDDVTPDGVTVEWDDHQFFQTPLVLASVVTARDEAATCELRTTSNTVKNVTFALEGSQTAEKVAYLVYNGQAKAGSVFNAKPLLSMTYSYSVGGWGECGNAGANPRAGTSTRAVECKGTNERTYDNAYCEGEAPVGEEDCCIPATSAAFEGKNCGMIADGCGGEADLGACSSSCTDNVCMEWKKSTETPTANSDLGTWGEVEGCADGVVATGARFKVQGFQGTNALVKKYDDGAKNMQCSGSAGVKLAEYQQADDSKATCSAKCDETEGCAGFDVAGRADGYEGPHKCRLFSACEPVASTGSGESGCSSIAGTWTSNGADDIVLTQDGCKGSSGSWDFKVDGESATIVGHGVTGTVSATQIHWSNGIMYARLVPTAYLLHKPQDDTGVNAVELVCANGARVTSSEGSKGEWGQEATCDGIVGVRVRSLTEQGDGDTQDDVGVTAVEFKCADGTVLKSASIDEGTSWASRRRSTRPRAPRTSPGSTASRSSAACTLPRAVVRRCDLEMLQLGLTRRSACVGPHGIVLARCVGRPAGPSFLWDGR